MDENENKEHFKHAITLYAHAKGYALSPFADKVINRCLTVCEGKCPCDMSRGFCPCGEHEKEIEEAKKQVEAFNAPKSTQEKGFKLF